MKILYFDIDGTVLLTDTNKAKPCLANGRFEAGIRRAGFSNLVCVGNFARIAHAVKGMGLEYDELGVLFGICGGAFSDEKWFRSVTTLVSDPEQRTTLIDFSGNWWYMDDLANEYFHAGGQVEILSAHLGNRVLIPNPTGDGQDVLEWLNAIAV